MAERRVQLADGTARAPGLRAAWSLPATVAGLVAVVVSFAGPSLIILAAASAGGLSTAETTSWLWAVSIGSGLTCLTLSLVTRQPVITAWSTPGAALLLGSLSGHDFSDVVGAYLVCAVVTLLLAVTGAFGRILAAIPGEILAAVLAGVLVPFLLGAVTAAGSSPAIGLAVVASFLVGRRFAPRYAVLLALVVGVVAAVVAGTMGDVHVELEIARPVWTAPTFDLGTVVGIGLPLLLVTLSAQNGPGLEMLRVSGYQPNPRLLVGGTAVAWALLAPFGAHGINLAAITAGICTGPQAHPARERRYVAGVVCGLAYLLVGLFAGGLVEIFHAVPTVLVATVAGVALLGALTGALRGMFVTAGGDSAPARVVEPAVVAFLVTASGVLWWRVGSAFWGLVLGVLVWLVLSVGVARAARKPTRTGEGAEADAPPPRRTEREPDELGRRG